jgi:hypothetical protein
MSFFIYKKIKSAFKRVDFVGDEMFYIILRGSWCDTIVMNMHVPIEDNSNDKNYSFYQEL